MSNSNVNNDVNKSFQEEVKNRQEENLPKPPPISTLSVVESPTYNLDPLGQVQKHKTKKQQIEIPMAFIPDSHITITTTTTGNKDNSSVTTSKKIENK